MTDLPMPRLSESMEEGTILRWLKRDGERIAVGEELVEIETDKATVTYAAEVAGALELVETEGSTVPVGAVIARVGETVQTDDTREPRDGGGEARTEADKDADAAAQATVAPADIPTPPPPSAPVAQASGPGGDGAAGAQHIGAAPDAPVLATPLARRAAGAHGVDLDGLTGSGPRGRITRGDVLAAAGITEEAPPIRRPAASVATDAPPAPQPRDARRTADGAPAKETGAVREAEIREPTRVQQVIARRMAEAKATIPDFEVEVDVVMDGALAMRAALKDLTDRQGAPSINDFVVKACAIALRRHPRVNASYADGKFKLHRRINVGVAVASEDALLVPVVYDADTKSLGAIASETRRLAARARAGEIAPPELSGGTFTVSNLGMFGMSAIRPVLNLPQAAILGVGATRETLARVDGEVIDRRLMTLTLTADHRILYGADAARFLADVKDMLESPLKLVL